MRPAHALCTKDDLFVRRTTLSKSVCPLIKAAIIWTEDDRTVEFHALVPLLSCRCVIGIVQLSRKCRMEHPSGSQPNVAARTWRGCNFMSTLRYGLLGQFSAASITKDAMMSPAR